MAEPDLETLLERIIGVVVDLLPVTAASLILWDGDRKTFSVSASTLESQSPRYVLKTVRNTGGATRWIVDHQEPLIVADVDDDPFGASEMLATERLRSYLGVPLVFNQASVGVLYALDRARRSYPQVDVDFMTILARRAASAIGFTRLLETTRDLATIDDLTGVWNRREFLARGETELERAERSQRPVTAIVFDVDNFKSINDRHGHVTGDAVLRAVAQRCDTEIRPNDVLGRVGGEEFALLVPDVEPRVGLVIAERLRERIASTPIVVDQGTYDVTVTLGVARSVPNEPLTALLHRADLAMYDGKAAGRNRVVADPDASSSTHGPAGSDP